MCLCRRALAAALFDWELVDPVVADPIAQDNDKRNNLQKMYRSTGNCYILNSQNNFHVTIM